MRRDQLGIHTTQPYGLHPMLAQGRQQIDVDLTGVHQLGDLERGVVGDAAAGHHPRLEAEPAAQCGGLGPAAVHDDDPDSQRRKQGQLPGDAVEHLGRRQDVAAELHHEDVVAIRPDVAECALEAGNALGCVDRQCCVLQRVKSEK